MRSLERCKDKQKMQKIQQLSESCREVISEGSRRAGKDEGPEAGRRRAGDFADVCVSWL